MANLGSNSLWSDIATGSPNVKTDLLGPDYSYANTIPGPSSLGVGSDGTFSQLGSNADAVATYVKTMITGDPPLGDQYFVNTGGVCVAPDKSLQPRSNYINNKPQTQNDLPPGLKDLGSDFNGLIPGTVGDIASLNPLYLFKALSADAEPPCKCYKCDVTSGGSTGFLTSELTPDFDPANCQEVDPSQCMTSKESFSNYDDIPISPIPTILAVIALGYFVFSRIRV